VLTYCIGGWGGGWGGALGRQLQSSADDQEQGKVLHDGDAQAGRSTVNCCVVLGG